MTKPIELTEKEELHLKYVEAQRTIQNLRYRLTRIDYMISTMTNENWKDNAYECEYEIKQVFKN